MTDSHEDGGLWVTPEPETPWWRRTPDAKPADPTPAEKQSGSAWDNRDEQTWIDKL